MLRNYDMLRITLSELQGGDVRLGFKGSGDFKHLGRLRRGIAAPGGAVLLSCRGKLMSPNHIVSSVQETPCSAHAYFKVHMHLTSCRTMRSKESPRLLCITLS